MAHILEAGNWECWSGSFKLTAISWFINWQFVAHKCYFARQRFWCCWNDTLQLSCFTIMTFSDFWVLKLWQKVIDNGPFFIMWSHLKLLIQNLNLQSNVHKLLGILNQISEQIVLFASLLHRSPKCQYRPVSRRMIVNHVSPNGTHIVAGACWKAGKSFRLILLPKAHHQFGILVQ